MILIPIIAGVLYLVGGQWWKPARWLMGIPIGCIGAFHLFSTTHSIPNASMALCCFPLYWIATSAFPYGDKSFLNIFGDYGKWAICGFVFGLASAPILGYWSVAQAIISGGGFVLLHWLDDRGIVKNPFQEILRGVVGTIVFCIA